MNWYELVTDDLITGLDQPLALRERAKPQASTIASACHETCFNLIILCDISMHEFESFLKQFLQKKKYIEVLGKSGSARFSTTPASMERIVNAVPAPIRCLKVGPMLGN